MKLLPSLASSDLTDVKRTIQRIEALGLSELHLDIEDGHFSPNITFGIKMTRDLRLMTSMDFSIHLMVTDPERWIEPLCGVGVQEVIFHLEAVDHPFRLFEDVRSCAADKAKCTVGVAVNPKTPPEALKYFTDDIDTVLVMTTDELPRNNRFIPAMYDKIRLCSQFGVPKVVVDGDVHAGNIAQIRAAGGTHAVVGRALFHNGDVDTNYGRLISAFD